jgi:hypothetical protein
MKALSTEKVRKAVFDAAIKEQQRQANIEYIKRVNREVQYALDILDKKITLKDVPENDQYMVQYHVDNVVKWNRPRPTLREVIE